MKTSIFFNICLAFVWGSVLQAQSESDAWVEPVALDSSFVLDMRYASPHNFAGEQLYPCARCFLRPEAAVALARVQKALSKNGLGLRLYDCYRPAPVQQKLWDQFPDPSYVTPPWKGSNHNRGLAVDVGLTDSCSTEIDMGSGFDHLGKISHHDYKGHSPEVLKRRKLLKEAMEKEGFSAIRTEWWHYNYYQVKYPIDEFEWKCN
ncbi:MAG TPA: M15 family metallopeptidase [Saprospiraceae bacterium]|nr:M15 family metallopeptidase [Saprospiraceae bacterium]